MSNTPVDRFFTFVVKGEVLHHPGLRGDAVGDDGYGRF